MLPSASTYFLCVDLAASGIGLDDEAFAQQAVERAGVAVVPLSPFAEQNPPHHMIRLCFAKRDETIDAGVKALETILALQKNAAEGVAGWGWAENRAAWLGGWSTSPPGGWPTLRL